MQTHKNENGPARFRQGAPNIRQGCVQTLAHNSCSVTTNRLSVPPSKGLDNTFNSYAAECVAVWLDWAYASWRCQNLHDYASNPVPEFAHFMKMKVCERYVLIMQFAPQTLPHFAATHLVSLSIFPLCCVESAALSGRCDNQELRIRQAYSPGALPALGLWLLCIIGSLRVLTTVLFSCGRWGLKRCLCRVWPTAVCRQKDKVLLSANGRALTDRRRSIRCYLVECAVGDPVWDELEITRKNYQEIYQRTNRN
jgi:hypothetical protein